jgi:hypothetical protein
MEASAADTSPTPSGRGFKGVLAKARQPGNSSTPSFNGTDNSSEGHGLRYSIDSVGEKLLVSRQSSIDDGSTSTKSRKLSKLIPKRILNKVGNHGATGEPRREGEEAGEGDPRGRTTVGQAGTLMRSRSALGRDGGSSLNLYDDEDES